MSCRAVDTHTCDQDKAQICVSWKWRQRQGTKYKGCSVTTETPVAVIPPWLSSPATPWFPASSCGGGSIASLWQLIRELSGIQNQDWVPCISYFSCCYDTGKWKAGRLLQAQDREGWWQEPEEARQVGFIEDSRERSVQVLSSLSPFNAAPECTPGNGAAHTNLCWITPQTGTKACLFDDSKCYQMVNNINPQFPFCLENSLAVSLPSKTSSLSLLSPTWAVA